MLTSAMDQLRWWVRFGEQGWVNSRERQGFFVIRHLNRENSARCDNAVSDSKVGSPANSGVLRLGSIATAVLDSRS